MSRRGKRAIRVCMILVLLGLVLIGGTVWFLKEQPSDEDKIAAYVRQQASTEEAKYTEEELAVRKASKEKFTSYVQAVDENGIAIDMESNPYFTEKMPGYEYPEALTISYSSGLTEAKRHASVILPVDYNESKSYPVLYLLHGLGGSHRTWLNKKADIIIRNLNYFMDIPEMIVVLPNSEVNEAEDTDDLSLAEKVAAYDKTEEDLVNYLMPYIANNFSIKTGRENTAIAGNSMGGRNTLCTAFRHPELFGYVGAFSSANVLERPEASALGGLLTDVKWNPEVEPFTLFMLMVGKTDDVCGWVTYDLDKRLTQEEIPHIFYDVSGGHNTYVWQNAIYNFCQRIFIS